LGASATVSFEKAVERLPGYFSEHPFSFAWVFSQVVFAPVSEIFLSSFRLYRTAQGFFA
jgi:hypothetical protein